MAAKDKELVMQDELVGFQSELGVVLKKAREAQKLSIQDVCGRLHFNPKLVQALEEDEFTAFNDPAHARSFIRGYARLLGLDEEALLDKHRQLFPEQVLNAIGIKTETMVMTSRAFEMPNYSWIIGVLVILVALIWALSKINFTSFSETKAPEAAPAVSTEALPEVALPAAERATESDAQQLTTEIQLPPAQATKSEATAPESSKTEPAKAEATNTVDVQLNATENSWVTVKDSAGKTIFTKLVKAGSNEHVRGIPPLNLHIGNAKGTQVLLNGQSVDFSASIYNNTARVTLGAE
jgi:cytoskeleton protein RodZ